MASHCFVLFLFLTSAGLINAQSESYRCSKPLFQRQCEPWFSGFQVSILNTNIACTRTTAPLPTLKQARLGRRRIACPSQSGTTRCCSSPTWSSSSPSASWATSSSCSPCPTRGSPTRKASQGYKTFNRIYYFLKQPSGPFHKSCYHFRRGQKVPNGPYPAQLYYSLTGLTILTASFIKHGHLDHSDHSDDLDHFKVATSNTVLVLHLALCDLLYCIVAMPYQMSIYTNDHLK